MKPGMFLLCLLACFNNTYAQASVTEQKVAGGNNFDFLTCMVITKDGGLMAAGYSQSNISGEKTQDSRGGYDYWIVKFNRLGDIEWDKTIGGNADDHLNSVLQTSDGGYILGGFSASDISGEKTESSRGRTDYWVVKINSAGIVEWDKTIGGNSYDALTSIKQTTDGGYLLGGSSSSDKSAEKTEASRGYDDYWIVKLNSLGNIEWDRTIGGSSRDFLALAVQTKDKGYMLGGSSESDISGEKTENSRGRTDYWIVKLNSAGTVEWDKTLGGSGFGTNGSDQLTALVQTKDGGYILGGYSDSRISGEKSQGRKGGTDFWLIKLDSLHQVQWDRTIGGDNTDALYALCETEDGGYMAAGSSLSGISGDKTETNRGDFDYWVVKINKLGNPEWNKTIGGNRYDNLAVIKEIQKNQFVLGGYSLSDKSGDKIKKPRGLYDYWIVNLNYSKPVEAVPDTAENAGAVIAVNTNSTNSFSVYPVPAKGLVHIKNNRMAMFSLINNQGQVLITKTFDGNGEINVSNLPEGLYFIKNVTTGAVQKIIVCK